MAVSTKTLYSKLKAQVIAEGERVLRYFTDDPLRREDVESIYELIVEELDSADEVTRCPATLKPLYPGGELDAVKRALRDLEEGIDSLQTEDGLQDTPVLYSVKRLLQDRADQLERIQDPKRSHR